MASTTKLLKDMSLDQMLKLRSEIDERVAEVAASEVAELHHRFAKVPGKTVETNATANPFFSQCRNFPRP